MLPILPVLLLLLLQGPAGLERMASTGPLAGSLPSQVRIDPVFSQALLQILTRTEVGSEPLEEAGPIVPSEDSMLPARPAFLGRLPGVLLTVQRSRDGPF